MPYANRQAGGAHPSASRRPAPPPPAVPRLQHTPPADTDIVERRASRNACGIGFAAEHTVDLTGAICAARPSFRNPGVPPCTWNRAQESPGRARTSVN